MKKFFCAAAIAAIGVCSVIPFGGCKLGDANVEYTLSEDGTYYIVSGVSGDKRGLTEYDVPATYCAEEGGEALPVKQIGYEAFFECNKLTRVTLPDSIEKIDVRAFAKCAFSQFIIPESVTEICFGAFGMCEALTEVTIPQSVTKLEPLAFAYCIRLKTACVKANITVLEDQVLCNTVASYGGNVYTNTALKSVYLSASIKKICNTALSGNVLTDIYFAGSKEQWNELYFYENVKDETSENGNKENRLEKSDVIDSSVTIHYNAKF